MQFCPLRKYIDICGHPLEALYERVQPFPGDSDKLSCRQKICMLSLSQTDGIDRNGSQEWETKYNAQQFKINCMKPL